MVLGCVSVGTSVVSTVCTGIEYGIHSKEFVQSAASTGVGLITFGMSTGLSGGMKLGGDVVPVARRIVTLAHDLVSPAIGILSLF
jgi:hypothetical protein